MTRLLNLTFIILSITVSACGKPVPNTASLIQGNKLADTDIVWVPESTSFETGFNAAPPSLATDERTVFLNQWEKLLPKLADEITPDQLALIVRSSEKHRVTKISLADLQRVRLHPNAATTDAHQVLFSVRSEESPIDVGSNRSIVKRRLVIAAVYDRNRMSILRIYVTIRGWVEE